MIGDVKFNKKSRFTFDFNQKLITISIDSNGGH
jgi:hypothetical protein